MKQDIKSSIKDDIGLNPAEIDQITTIVPAGMIETAMGHIREVMAALCVLIIVLAVWGGYVTYRDREEAKAALLLANALSEKNNGNTIELLNELVQKYSHSQAARQALLMLGSTYRDAGQTDKAIDAFSLAKKQFPADSALAAASSLGIGYLNEEKHIFAQAKKEFTEAARNKAFSSIATLDLARVLAVSGDKDGALEAYSRYLSLTKEPAQLDFVRYKVAELSTGAKAKK